MLASKIIKGCCFAFLLGACVVSDANAMHMKQGAMFQALSEVLEPLVQLSEVRTFRKNIESFSLSITEVSMPDKPRAVKTYEDSLKKARVVTLDSVVDGCCREDPQNEEYYQRLRSSIAEENVEFLCEEFRIFVKNLLYRGNIGDWRAHIENVCGRLQDVTNPEVYALMDQYSGILDGYLSSRVSFQRAGYLSIRDIAELSYKVQEGSEVLRFKRQFIEIMEVGIRSSAAFRETIVAFLAALKYRLSTDRFFRVALYTSDCLGVRADSGDLDCCFMSLESKLLDSDLMSRALRVNRQLPDKSERAVVRTCSLPIWDKYRHELGHAIFCLLGIQPINVGFSSYDMRVLSANLFVRDLLLTPSIFLHKDGVPYYRKGGLQYYWSDQLETCQIAGLMFDHMDPSLVVINRLSDATYNIKRNEDMKWTHSGFTKEEIASFTGLDQEYLKLFPSVEVLQVFLWLQGLEPKKIASYLVNHCK